ncbi:hypothetical protein KP509_12G036200 [Ceratopteris richardii]|uniref:Secreted protein n=1 Tax=Ceratopteris richardii TaxID=49495 RepID=A0A8T2TK48_CERRI|nr:hypothetical protein KP509_12G036200 [Ceratopteris richardii]
MVMQRTLGTKWGHAMLGLLCVVAACRGVCDTVSVVDVSHMIQYDLQGVPFSCRRAALNHHTSSLLVFSNSSQASDLSRSVIIVPVTRSTNAILKDLSFY